MAQVLEFRLPDLGEGLTEATIVRWLVEVGDVVAVDQTVVEVETAKAMVDVPCPYGGVVTARFGEEGAELPVGEPLLTVAVGAAASGEGDEGSGNVLVGYGTAAPPARRGRVRPSSVTGTPASRAPGAPTGTRTGSADAGSVVAAPNGGRELGRAGDGPAARADDGDHLVADGRHRPGRDGHDRPADGGRGGVAVIADGPVPVMSPLVRRLARENGVDLRELEGSGPDGLILRADVEYALRAAATGQVRPAAAEPLRAPAVGHGAVAPIGAPLAQSPHQPATAPGASPHGTRIPLRGIRGAVADKLSRSRREIPDATCWVDADATELMQARAAMNSAGGPKISLLALLARICTAALARHPELNSTVDMEAREVVQLDQVHLGFAAQTERGLVVPVVRDAHARGAESLSAEFARLTEAARTGTLTPRELTGGTFTLNNYGVFGVDGSTPIINHPEAAMLGVGRIVPKPWVHQGELAVRQVVQLSLTFDHRVCDGGTAGGFLRYVADCVEQPAVLLRTL
ncbi:2-oxo acid dehydrogenase subunit E2 [Streptomyces sp. NBC_00243]|uniref:dihydrolipoamide acetyltransferase family protein n=1 Tax=Streptomyces sp. NBC_00243 TaxID=2975688 RepID=UPI002DDA5055|nr:dihydrolipoamide acetyltransferase family protein [Streptomyces sp. NBC_00243]WRZ21196.1 2-oxo acid dehydrogenase subunit E2 [Streptomyces sp. NBC_00243]